MKKYELNYFNYIFVLIMGIGKMILMVICIFYEFLLVNKYFEDLCFCYNVIVFVLDKIVLEFLCEI